LAATLFVSGFAGGPAALADSDYFQPGNLLLSPTFPTGPLILEFCRKNASRINGR
jgi:hypothetical protein